MPSRTARFWLAFGGAVLALGGAMTYWLLRPDSGDARLNALVNANPPVPVVFTSRSEPTSFVAAAAEGEGFTEPGQRQWAAREGRLRLLTPRGTVHELTWGKSLSGGGTLIDVMSPSVSLDAKRILFAGRRSDSHGRFRLYEIGIDGSGLRQLTGGPDDEGCVAAPPLRWRATAEVIPDDERRAADYDDVDPVELHFAERRIVFASSRTPDLGRDHARRSTTLWVLHADGSKFPASANRNNDRWPFLLTSRYLAFSLWSRNREVISADLGDIRPVEEGVASASQPTDAWLGAFTQMPGGHFGMLIKPRIPVWRPRPLFANRITFMTTLGDDGALTVVQVPPGLIANAPSALAQAKAPRSEGTVVRRSPERDEGGRRLWLATPSPCPPSGVLLSAAPVVQGAKTPAPGDYGLYLARDDWPEGQPPSIADIDMRLLFDDPDFVDAEPVGVYPRKITTATVEKSVTGTPPKELRLANTQAYRGPLGQVLATAIDARTPMGDLPGQRTDANQSPIFDGPPPGAVDHLRIYAARRDRFDDKDRPRITGTWELLLKVPVQKGTAATWVPTDAPTVLAGFDKSGRVVEWSTPAKDSQGQQARFYAYAGDHYSLTQSNGKHFCVGCHPGHSGVSLDHHDHAERLR